MLKKYFFIAVIALSFGQSAFSKAYSMRKAPKVIGQEVEKQLTGMQRAFKEMDFSETHALMNHPDSKEAWVLSRVRLMVQPLLKFKYLIFGLKVAPLIEFRWQRKPPRGWKYYHPIK